MSQLPRYAVLVVWKGGQEEYLKEGNSSTPAKYFSFEKAKEQADFMLIGMKEDVQSINAVDYPAREDWV